MPVRARPRRTPAFPSDFVWGAAAASYQVEGAAFDDGKGESVWDMFCRKTGAVWRNQSGDVACDHYHRYRADVALMKRLGIRAYRLSLSWPRVLPQGTGPVNARGLDFYDRLVDALLTAGITPYATLFHWDYPLALYHRGGWLNRDSAGWFADYARVVAERLSDRVRHWMTLNEPQVYIGLGHQTGLHAPGDKLRFAEVLRAGHNTLRAHGRAVVALRAAAKARPSIGFAFVASAGYPATGSRADVDAARSYTLAVRSRDTWSNTWWMDPVLKGVYPKDGLALFGADAPAVEPGDMEEMAQPLDFIGLNIYSANPVRRGQDGTPEVVPPPQGNALTGMEWPVTPEALRWAPRFLHERYGKPVYITENGLSCRDWVSLDGRVHDPQRIDFTARYLRELRRACADGVPVAGYFHWSIMDNFEWAEGYKQRFGLVFVDYPTQKRIPKDSALWYRKIIASNGRALPLG